MKYEVEPSGEVYVFITQQELDGLKNNVMAEIKISMGTINDLDLMNERLKLYFSVTETANKLQKGDACHSLADNKVVYNVALFYFVEKQWENIVLEIRKLWKGHIGVRCILDAISGKGDVQ